MPAEYPPKEELEARRRAEKIATGGQSTESAQLRPAEQKGRRISALALRLAARLRVDPDELAASWPEDTLRRTKYPVVEEPQEDGSVLYKQNPMRP
jgi:hypothetical protein